MANKWVYLFSEGNANMRELLGGKGANLAEMTSLGLPVPQGFTITTEAMKKFRDRLTNTSLRWKKSQERNSVIRKILYLFLFVQELELQCQV